MKRMTINLRPEEYRALQVLARRERRDPEAQAELVIRERLLKVGILPADTCGKEQAGRPLERTAED